MPGRRVLGWLTERSWRTCVEAIAALRRADDDVTLLYVQDAELSEHLHGAYAALLGRGGGEDPGAGLDRDEELIAEQVTAAASAALGTGSVVVRRGPVEREVVAAAAGFDVLVAVRDGDGSRLGPKSIGRQVRFVVDHAPCAIVLVWPEQRAPAAGTGPGPLAH